MEIESVFIASPWYNKSEEKLNLEIARVLQDKGFKTYLPQRDRFPYEDLVHQFSKIEDLEKAKERAIKVVSHIDIYQAGVVCNSMVLNINGRVPDEDALIQAGIAFRSGKPLVVYCNDHRSLKDRMQSPLIHALADSCFVKNIKDIPERLILVASRMESDYSKIIKIAEQIPGSDCSTVSIDKVVKAANRLF